MDNQCECAHFKSSHIDGEGKCAYPTKAEVPLYKGPQCVCESFRASAEILCICCGLPTGGCGSASGPYICCNCDCGQYRDKSFISLEEGQDINLAKKVAKEIQEKLARQQ